MRLVRDLLRAVQLVSVVPRILANPSDDGGSVLGMEISLDRSLTRAWQRSVLKVVWMVERVLAKRSQDELSFKHQRVRDL